MTHFISSLIPQLSGVFDVAKFQGGLENDHSFAVYAEQYTFMEHFQLQKKTGHSKKCLILAV